MSQVSRSTESKSLPFLSLFLFLLISNIKIWPSLVLSLTCINCGETIYSRKCDYEEFYSNVTALEEAGAYCDGDNGQGGDSGSNGSTTSNYSVRCFTQFKKQTAPPFQISTTQSCKDNLPLPGKAELELTNLDNLLYCEKDKIYLTCSGSDNCNLQHLLFIPDIPEDLVIKNSSITHNRATLSWSNSCDAFDYYLNVYELVNFDKFMMGKNENSENNENNENIQDISETMAIQEEFLKAETIYYKDERYFSIQILDKFMISTLESEEAQAVTVFNLTDLLPSTAYKLQLFSGFNDKISLGYNEIFFETTSIAAGEEDSSIDEANPEKEEAQTDEFQSDMSGSGESELIDFNENESEI